MDQGSQRLIFVCFGALLGLCILMRIDQENAQDRDVQIVTLLQHKEHGDKAWCWR